MMRTLPPWLRPAQSLKLASSTPVFLEGVGVGVVVREGVVEQDVGVVARPRGRAATAAAAAPGLSSQEDLLCITDGGPETEAGAVSGSVVGRKRKAAATAAAQGAKRAHGGRGRGGKVQGRAGAAQVRIGRGNLLVARRLKGKQAEARKRKPAEAGKRKPAEAGQCKQGRRRLGQAAAAVAPARDAGTLAELLKPAYLTWEPAEQALATRRIRKVERGHAFFQLLACTDGGRARAMVQASEKHVPSCALHVIDMLSDMFAKGYSKAQVDDQKHAWRQLVAEGVEVD